MDKMYFKEDIVIDELRKLQKGEITQISDNVGSMFIRLVEGMLCNHNFVGYSPEIKEELKSEALVSLMKCLKKFDVQKYPDRCFGFFTRQVWFSFIAYLKKYYKDVNTKRMMLIEFLKSQGVRDDDPIIEKLISENQGTGK